MEAEYIGFASAAQDGIFLKQLFDFIQMPVELRMFVDNQSCILFAENEKGPRKNARHIMVKYHFVKDLVEKKVLNLLFVASSKNVADICKKALPKMEHQLATKMMGLNDTFIKVQGEC